MVGNIIHKIFQRTISLTSSMLSLMCALRAVKCIISIDLQKYHVPF